jgi:hypothetical protein
MLYVESATTDGRPALAVIDDRAGNGAHEWNRTIDLLLTKEVLYRLSYVSRNLYDPP